MILSDALADFLPAQNGKMETKMCDSLHHAAHSQENLPLVTWQATAGFPYDGLAPNPYFS